MCKLHADLPLGHALDERGHALAAQCGRPHARRAAYAVRPHHLVQDPAVGGRGHVEADFANYGGSLSHLWRFPRWANQSVGFHCSCFFRSSSLLFRVSRGTKRWTGL